jgi:polysaccharide export outer membrane protein
MQKPAAAPAPVAAENSAKVPGDDGVGFIPKGYQHQEIQPGDMLYVSVSPAEELSRDLAVDQDGKIFIPIIGAVEASGLSSDLLARRLAGLLSKYVTNPKVDVLIKQFSAQQISVMGQVRMAGSYPYRPNLRLLDVISMAGGLVPGANKTQIHIYRGSGASRKATIVDVQDALKTGDVTKDFLLQPGDLVDVPKGNSPLIIFGNIPRGGDFDYFKDMRLLDLISLCQGFSEGANFKEIKIFRGEAPNQKVITVHFNNVMNGDMRANILLQPGDIIYVPQRALWTYSALANMFVPFTTIILAISTIALVVKK